MSTYREVRLLAKDVLEDSAITRRRKAGEKLQLMLAKPEVRRRLAIEATPSQRSNRGGLLSPAAVVAARHKALSEMWRYIVRHSIFAVQQIASGSRAKITATDILMPYKILQCCDLPDETVDHSSSCFPGLSIGSPSKLSNKETRLVVNYCLEMLADEEALKLAELHILEMLAYVCSRREYVAFFRPHFEIQDVLEEVEKRLVVMENDNHDGSFTGHNSNDAAKAAGKVFDNLMKTTIGLGISMHLLMPACVKMVASWCSKWIEDTGSVRHHISELTDVMGGLTILLRSNTEQAIAPLIRHGRIILRFAKRCYVHADAPQRYILDDYFLCHLVVSQVAGKLQGLMPGDIGDLGKASLTPRQVSDLLDLIMSENLKRQTDAIELPMTVQQRTHLELTARLLACCQRLYLIDAEWEQIKDPTQTLISSIEELSQADDYMRVQRSEHLKHSVSSPPELFAQSPFAQHVLYRLHRLVPRSSETDRLVLDGNSPSEEFSSPVLDLLASSPSADTESRLPVDVSKSLIPLLNIVNACAEAFPTGECWTSSTHRYWRREISHSYDGEDNEALDVNGCSPDDLSTVVFTLSIVLEAHGGTNGDSEVQKWTLLCLLRLTQASASLTFLLRDTKTASYTGLQTAWRRVWFALFRSELRYAAYTKAAAPGSNGELVLLLLSQMVREGCTDPRDRWSTSLSSKQATFLHLHQADIWALPVFANSRSLRVPVLFGLISALLLRAGLSEQGADSIDHETLSDDGLDNSSMRDYNGRRFRLLGFCLLFLKHSHSSGATEAVTSCVATLVHGKVPPPSRYTSYTRKASDAMTGNSPDDIFSFTMLEGIRWDDPTVHSNDPSSLFAWLWCQPSFFDPLRPYLPVTTEGTSDVVGDSRLKFRRLFTSHDSLLVSADLVPQTESDALFSFLRPRLAAMMDQLFPGDFSHTEGAAEVELDATLSRLTLAMKATLGVCLTCREGLVAFELERLSPSVSKLFRLVASKAESMCNDEDELVVVMSDLEQIIRCLVHVASEARLDWKESIIESAGVVFDAFHNLLQGYTVGDAEETSAMSPSSNASVDHFMEGSDGDELFDDEPSDTDVDEDFDGDIMPSSRKRKRGATKRKRSRKRESEQPRKNLKRNPKRNPDTQCIVLIASVLVSLKPSYKVCELVAKALLGTNDAIIGSEARDETAVNPVGAMHAVAIICSEETILYGTAQSSVGAEDTVPSGEESVVSLISRLIELIRANTGPESELHLFGFDVCARSVLLGESAYRASSISRKEARCIVDLLKAGRNSTERRSLWNRPRFRAEQLNAAVAAFRGGRDNFHAEMDKEFPKVFALPSLCDLSGAVRRQASNAVAAALRVLPEDKVIESVRKRLPPVATFRAEDEVRKEYRKWYSDRDNSSRDGKSTLESQAWEDAFLSIEWGVLDCWSAIAGAASKVRTTQDVAFQLVHLSFLRPDLEGLCFQTLDRIATRLSFETAENVVDAEKEEMIDLWLKSGNKLLNCPLLLTAPNLLRRLLRSGKYHALAHESETDPKSLDVTRIRETAASEFVSRCCGVILPRVLSLSVSIHLKSPVTKEGSCRLIENDYMKELCSVFEDRYDDDIAKKVFRCHIPEIFAYCCALQCGSEDDQKVAAEIDRLISGLLSEEAVQRLGSKGANLTVRRVLELSGMSSFQGQSPSLANERFREALMGVVHRFGSSMAANGDIFVRVGSSMTEFLLFAKLWLQKSFSASQMERRWSPLQLLSALVVENMRDSAYDGLQLCFCIHCLSTVILDPKMSPVYDQALAALESILKAALESILKEASSIKADLASLAKELLGFLMHVHERGQEALVKHWTEERNGHESALRRCIGILGLQHSNKESSDTWGWKTSSPVPVDVCFPDFSEVQKTASNHVSGALISTYDILALIVEHVVSIGLESDDFIGASPPYEVPVSKRELLAEADPKFCAQNAMQHFLSQHVFDDDTIWDGGLIRVPAMLKRQRCKGKVTGQAPTDSRYFRAGKSQAGIFSMEERLLRAELAELERYLRRLRGDGDSTSKCSWKQQEIISLLDELCAYCSAQYSEQVRLAAARCLGELDLKVVLPLLSSDKQVPVTRGWIDQAVKSGHLLRSFQCNSIFVLASCLKSPDVTIALVALETLKLLLACRDGEECRKVIRDTETMKLLDPLISPTMAESRKSLLLTDQEIDEIKGLAGLETRGKDSSEDWCWDEKLWRCCENPEDLSFDEWICCLVPALIVCCYGNIGDDPSQSKQSAKGFFILCQRMSYLDPGFAVSLFPAITLDLLEREESSREDATGVLADTWIGSAGSELNTKLSKSFTALFRGCHPAEREDTEKSGSSYPRAVGLAVECLEVLRLLTQHRFKTSKNHKRNPVALGGKESTRAATSATSRKRSPGGSDFNRDLGDSPPWSGVPFGVVLRLDGLLVARACMRTKAYATAIFYAEMYADARFGGSTSALDLLTSDRSQKINSLSPFSTADISGFANASGRRGGSPDSTTDHNAALTDGLSFLSVIQSCLAELGEGEAHKAVAQQISDSTFFGGSTLGSFRASSRHGERSPSLEYLQRLDNLSSLERGPTSAGIAIAECLEGLGLRSTLQAYVLGMTSGYTSGLSQCDREVLRDKWFECCLFDMQWDDSLFSGDASVPVSTRRLGHSDALLLSGQCGDRAGFHECMAKSLAALVRGDMISCCNRLELARCKLLRHVSREAPQIAKVRVLDRLQALNDLECLARKEEPALLTLKRWGLDLGTPEDTTNVRATLLPCSASGSPSSPFQDFSAGVREITLRAMYTSTALNQSGDKPTVLNRIAAHLWRVCSLNCALRQHAVAEAALQRLYSLVEFSEKELGVPGDDSVVFRLRLQEASLLESKGDFSGAIRTCKQTIRRLDQDKTLEALHADALVTCGYWMTKHKVEPANSILDHWLKPGADKAKSIYCAKGDSHSARRATTAFLALGQLVSNLFETVSARVKGLEWQKAGRNLRDRELELKNCQPLIDEARKQWEKATSGKRGKKGGKEAVALDNAHRELMIYRQSLEREVTNVRSEREKIQSSVEEYRSLAIDYIASALSLAEAGGADDLSKHVYRLVSLWFASEHNWGNKIDAIIAEAIERIPTFHFVPLASQLFSRIDRKSTELGSFQVRLQRLVKKMCLDHPYHCIIQMITLSNGKKVGTGVSGRSATAFMENSNDAKVDAAREILMTLKKEDPGFIRGLIESYEVLTDAYIGLAMASTTEFHRGNTKKIPFSSVTKATGSRLDQCLGTGNRKVPYPPCILTKIPPLRPGCDYGDGMEDPIGGERIAGFDTHLSITDSGLHRPKIVVCVGSKGGRFKQLVKGEDEIRQDAVMEQVFGYVNELMAKRGRSRGEDLMLDSSTNAARGFAKGLLKVVTYNIIPLSPASGVLEWVEDTIPFGDYILDRGSRKTGVSIGAHARYFPGEWSTVLCREQYRTAPKSHRRKTFDAICEHHSPVFRFFFVERFGYSAEAWHAAKMRYTRSVAVNSIVGHVLGIGDRHTSNILVHEITGEVVHIDFGIVFEQGKLLNTPERVPFRLTRNVVDGMGPTGTEGTFTKAAEATLAVLKHNANALLTILSAIVADPLYKWSVSPVKARERQRLMEKDDEDGGGRVAVEDSRGSTSNARDDYLGGDRNEAAANTIAKIQEKLQGYEDGTSGEQQSVEGQVQLLINSARDRDNLCEMFQGWAPWL